MGPIYNRTKEHLGTSDTGIITVRRRLIEAARRHSNDGQTPPEVMHPEVYAIRADATFLDPGEPWFESTTERRKVHADWNPDSPR
jgi:hypothetical protein